MAFKVNAHNIYHLRFDRTQPEPIQTAFSCGDFRQSLYADAMAYYDMKRMMVCDAEKIQKAFDFLNACAAYAQTEKVDADMFEMENGFEAVFRFDTPVIGAVILSGLAGLIQQCDRCDVDAGDSVPALPDAAACTVRLYLFTHRECALK